MCPPFAPEYTEDAVSPYPSCMHSAKSSEPSVVFETTRLVVRPATAEDASLICELWTDPRVTTLVGFPKGIPTSVGEIQEQIVRDAGRPYARLLIAVRREDRAAIGQIKLGEPGADGIAEPDIKLSPAYWGQGYGRELWSAMIDLLFGETDCRLVQGTPNVANTASIRMMASCEMRRTAEGVFEPPERMVDVMVAVPHCVYRIDRETWNARRRGDVASSASPD